MKPNTEIINAKVTINRLASNGNRLAMSLLKERVDFKQNHINDTYTGFNLVFYYNPNKSASWGSHIIRFEAKDSLNPNAGFNFEQHQVRFLESEASVYQNFMKDFFEILSALIEDYRSRNPIAENDINDCWCD